MRLVLAEHDKNTWVTGINVEALAEQGDPKAQLMLGWLYYVGYGVARDKSVAVKWYETAARAGLPEAERLLELISTECDRPSIAGLVIGGQPRPSGWKLAGKGLFLAVILAAILSVSYYYWPRNQQPVVAPENGVVDSEQEIGIENEPNLHVDEAGTSADDIELDHSNSTKEPKPIVKVTEQETIVHNSSGEDPNSIPIPESKSIIEKLAEQADKWLEESPNKED